MHEDADNTMIYRPHGHTARRVRPGTAVPQYVPLVDERRRAETAERKELGMTGKQYRKYRKALRRG